MTKIDLRIDRVKKPLEPPYEGPFLVLQRTQKFFTLLIKGEHVNISIDRIKPAYKLTHFDTSDAPLPSTVNSPASCEPKRSDSTERMQHKNALSDSTKDEKLPALTTQTRCGRKIKRPWTLHL
ncbi:uncharacterized protein LOC129980685 [Argiope bruennichi]|uniref:uncharacterized protein LOC129980685 n=1 Tax=Argiope bruennichi TaxID=94029 RepID=UPI0024943D17|nr:uncharacterized protein LOC129980685 [Argiope bruennichi]